MRDRLQAATEAMNPLILRAEEVFASLDLKTETSIPIVYSDPRSPTTASGGPSFGVGGGWPHIRAPRGPDDRAITRISPLTEASRETRAAALALIKDFHSALVAASGSV